MFIQLWGILRQLRIVNCVLIQVQIIVRLSKKIVRVYRTILKVGVVNAQLLIQNSKKIWALILLGNHK